MATEPALAAVEAAVRRNDPAALALALEALGESYLWGSLELRAHERIREGDLATAFGMLRAICDGPRTSLGAWNNLCWTINAMSDPPAPAIVEPLLARALTIGPMNVPLFHNLACAAVKVGLFDLAFEAVAGAARHGYAEIDKLAKDDDLAPIASDPRFAAALSATMRWTPQELDRLTTRLWLHGTEHVVHRAVMGMTFYLGGPLHHSAPRVAALLDAYLADLPPETMKFYARTCTFKPLTKAMLTRARKSLAELATGAYMKSVFLRPVEGDASEFEFRANGDLDDRTITVSLAFPLIEAHDPDAFADRFVRYAAMTGADTANAGYMTTNRENDSYEGIAWNRGELADRFLAIQNTNPWWAPGRAAPAHWLVWLSTALIAKIKDTGAAQRRDGTGGVMLRAAHLPPLAPRAKPDDVGALPDIARALEPLRIEARGPDNIAQLVRWANVPSTRWDNAPGGWAPIATRLVAEPNQPTRQRPKQSRKKKSFFDS